MLSLILKIMVLLKFPSTKLYLWSLSQKWNSCGTTWLQDKRKSDATQERRGEMGGRQWPERLGCCLLLRESKNMWIKGTGRDRFSELSLLEKICETFRDFPGGPLVKSPRFYCRGYEIDLHCMAKKKKKLCEILSIVKINTEKHNFRWVN